MTMMMMMMIKKKKKQISEWWVDFVYKQVVNLLADLLWETDRICEWIIEVIIAN
jgi:hypothetical protein